MEGTWRPGALRLSTLGALDLTCLPVKWGEPASTGVSGQTPGPAPALAGFLAAGQSWWGWRRLRAAALCTQILGENEGIWLLPPSAPVCLQEPPNRAAAPRVASAGLGGGSWRYGRRCFPLLLSSVHETSVSQEAGLSLVLLK